MTLTTHEAVNPPSAALAVTVVTPGFIAVTLPEASTEATELLLDVQVTFLLVAFDGVKTGVI